MNQSMSSLDSLIYPVPGSIWMDNIGSYTVIVFGVYRHRDRHELYVDCAQHPDLPHSNFSLKWFLKNYTLRSPCDDV